MWFLFRLINLEFSTMASSMLHKHLNSLVRYMFQKWGLTPRGTYWMFGWDSSRHYTCLVPCGGNVVLREKGNTISKMNTKCWVIGDVVVSLFYIEPVLKTTAVLLMVIMTIFSGKPALIVPSAGCPFLTSCLQTLVPVISEQHTIIQLEITQLNFFILMFVCHQYCL